MRTSSWVAVGAVAVVVACGSTVTTPNDDAGPTDAAPDGIFGDGSFTDPSTTPCGTKRCAAEEFCIVPCTGGALTACAPEGDDGCPTGTVRGQCRGDAGPTPNGCAPAPPPSYCSREPSCGGATGIREGKTIECICP